MSDPGLSREKALGAALVLLGATVAIAVLAANVLSGQWRDAEFVDLASAEGATVVDTSTVGSELLLGWVPKSLAATESVEATSTETTSSANATMTASAGASTRGASAPSGAGGGSGVPGSSASGPSDPGASITPVTPGTPGTPDSSGRPGTPDAPGYPATPDTPEAPASKVTGRVYHEIWGTPAADVRLRLSPLQRTTDTGTNGAFSFAEVPDGRLVLVAVDDDDWLSHGSMMHAFATPQSDTITFGVYRRSESLGRNWRDAASWRTASSGELAAATARVSAASAVFRGISTSQASSVLGWSRSGTPEQRARAELLATWLDLATARLGFDTRVSTTNVSGASGILPASTSVLGLVRGAESVLGSGGRVNWHVLRRALTDRVLSS